MSEIINLNQKRKEMARGAKEKKSSENRRKHGLTKEEKAEEKAKKERAKQLLEGHKREKDEE